MRDKLSFGCGDSNARNMHIVIGAEHTFSRGRSNAYLVLCAQSYVRVRNYVGSFLGACSFLGLQPRVQGETLLYDIIKSFGYAFRVKN